MGLSVSIVGRLAETALDHEAVLHAARRRCGGGRLSHLAAPVRHMALDPLPPTMHTWACYPHTVRLASTHRANDDFMKSTSSPGHRGVRLTAEPPQKGGVTTLCLGALRPPCVLGDGALFHAEILSRVPPSCPDAAPCIVRLSHLLWALLQSSLVLFASCCMLHAPAASLFNIPVSFPNC